ncbi:MAG: valine--pyruvate aminotransferase [Verrucomicrobiales bacterium]|jgi:valine--pyruvate aminotransferase
MSLNRLAEPSGILELMDDLGRALTVNRDAIMMGGGNPAQIPEMQAIWREQTQQLLNDEAAFGDVLANYDPPAGNPAFRAATADFLRRHCGWDVGPENIAITTGGQTAFFFLLNLFSDNGKRILIPLMPEYIGYSQQGLREGIFATQPARIEQTGERRFKYRIDFENLEVGDDIGAICVSRPTNPSANVLTDNEIRRLSELAESRGIPLIIDNAYGLPFPGVIFTDAEPFWNRNVVQTLSLSKLGLPGTRTGIVVANEELISKIAAINAVVGLANNNIGQALTRTLIETDRLAEITKTIIRPFYEERCAAASSAIDQQLPADVPFALHEPEGAFFLWLWLDELPISCRELYLRLKERGVIVVPGQYFFFGLEEPWEHSRQCLRLSYTQPRERVERGIEIIADEVRRVYAG